MTIPIYLYFITAVFVLVETLISLMYGLKNHRVLKQECISLFEVGLALKDNAEGQPRILSGEFKHLSAVRYLKTCEDAGLQVREDDFIKLLTKPADSAFNNINLITNLLPVIGLIGTFLGITIGIFNINPNNHPQQVSDYARTIEPLLQSGKLAFISSFFGLLYAAILRSVFGNYHIKYNKQLEYVEEYLSIYYIPLLAPKKTEDRFAKTVSKLNYTIAGFVTQFQTSISGLINEFMPLVDEQKTNNSNTLEKINTIVDQLNNNTGILKAISDQQKQQITDFGGVAQKLNSASTSLSGSLDLAKDNLDQFVKLGKDMKDNISTMHKPLEDIFNKLTNVSGQNETIKTDMQKVFENINQIPQYIDSVQNYLGALNNKLETFKEVGTKVHEVKADFTDFSGKLDATLKKFVDEVGLFQSLMEKSFKEYDGSLKTLFDQVLTGGKDVNVTYYDPGTLKELKSIAERNQQLLDSMKNLITHLDMISMRMVDYIKNHKNWLQRLFSKQKGRGGR